MVLVYDTYTRLAVIHPVAHKEKQHNSMNRNSVWVNHVQSLHIKWLHTLQCIKSSPIYSSRLLQSGTLIFVISVFVLKGSLQRRS